jgi:hypothetical protein
MRTLCVAFSLVGLVFAFALSAGAAPDAQPGHHARLRRRHRPRHAGIGFPWRGLPLSDTGLT